MCPGLDLWTWLAVKWTVGRSVREEKCLAVWKEAWIKLLQCLHPVRREDIETDHAKLRYYSFLHILVF